MKVGPGLTEDVLTVGVLTVGVARAAAELDRPARAATEAAGVPTSEAAAPDAGSGLAEGSVGVEVA